MSKFLFSVILAGLALTGCADKTLPLATSNPALSVVSQGSMPVPTQADQPLGSRAYAVGPYDKLIVDVFGVEGMMAREITVDAGGYISFPLAGSFPVAGLTPAQIESELVLRLGHAHMRNPRVAVNLEEVNSQIVSVDGQVTRPGLYPALGGMTLMQAIARAEGLNEFAKQEDVVVFRQAGGQQYAALYNLAAIRRGYYADPAVYAGDRIVVGESRGRRLFRDILATAPLLTAPIIAILQNSGS